MPPSFRCDENGILKIGTDTEKHDKKVTGRFISQDQSDVCECRKKYKFGLSE